MYQMRGLTCVDIFPEICLPMNPAAKVITIMTAMLCTTFLLS